MRINLYRISFLGDFRYLNYHDNSLLSRIPDNSGKQGMSVHIMLFSLVGDAPQSPKFEEFHSSSCARFHRAEGIPVE